MNQELEDLKVAWNVFISVFAVYLKFPPDDSNGVATRHGCYVTIFDVKAGLPALTFPLGTPDLLKYPKYVELSIEKAKRLDENVSNCHLSSWVTRNEEKGKWGGAIMAGKWIISISGLVEHMDEAVAIVGAKTLGLIGNPVVESIISVSNNKYAAELNRLYVGR